MKFRSQILGFGMFGAAVATLVGGFGLFAASRLGSSIDILVGSDAAMAVSMEADMMHDAIRADAYKALLGAGKNDAAMVSESQQDYKEHAQTFHEALKRLSDLPIDDKSRQLLPQVQPLVDQYIESAATVIQSAAVEPKLAEAALPQLHESFKKLEAVMGELSESITSNSESHQTEATALRDQTKYQIAAILLFATAGIVFFALWLARSMSRPLEHAAQVSDQLAQGNLTTRINLSGNDETVLLLQSMSRMQANLADIVRGVKMNAEGVATASAEIAQGNTDLSMRTEQQASALEETAASMEQLGSAVRQNADSAQQANELLAMPLRWLCRAGKWWQQWWVRCAASTSPRARSPTSSA